MGAAEADCADAVDGTANRGREVVGCGTWVWGTGTWEEGQVAAMV